MFSSIAEAVIETFEQFLVVWCIPSGGFAIIMIDFVKQINVKIKVSTSRNEPKGFFYCFFLCI